MGGVSVHHSCCIAPVTNQWQELSPSSQSEAIKEETLSSDDVTHGPHSKSQVPYPYISHLLRKSSAQFIWVALMLNMRDFVSPWL